MNPRTNPSSRRIELNINSDPANLADVRRQVEGLAGECGFDEKSAGEIGLCVNEGLANVIRHAYGGVTDRPIVVTAEYAPADSALRIGIRDWGNGIDPTSLPPKPPDPLRPGGLGLVCLRSLMDETVYHPQPDGMLMKMTRRRTHAIGQSSADAAARPRGLRHG